MFGYDDDELERIRRGPSRVRLWVVALELVVAVIAAAPAVVLDILNDPVKLQALTQRAFPAAPFTVYFDEVEWLPAGVWYKPLTWRFAVTSFRFEAADPKKPDWQLARATASAPEPLRADGGWALHIPELLVNGLTIQAHQQRPPDPWEAKDNFIRMVLADEVRIRNASFEVPPDPPLGMAAARGIAGTLHDVTFNPGRREVNGSGSVRLESFTTGDITVTDGRLPVFELHNSTLHIKGTYQFAGAAGTVEGDIKTFHVRSEVDMHVTIKGAGLGEVIRTATGDTSAIDGMLDLDLQVAAGGSRPRGSSLLWGDVSVREGKIQLGKNTRFVVLDALTLLPWVDLNAYNQVELQPMNGGIELTRGRVVAKEWTYPAGKRKLRVDGTIEDGNLYFFVRLLPRDDLAALDEKRKGIGLLMWGDRLEQRFKLATQEDLSIEDPWVPRIAEQTTADGEKAGHLFSRKKKDEGDEAPREKPEKPEKTERPAKPEPSAATAPPVSEKRSIFQKKPKD